jgi:hypothetical protein
MAQQCLAIFYYIILLVTFLSAHYSTFRDCPLPFPHMALLWLPPPFPSFPPQVWNATPPACGNPACVHTALLFSLQSLCLMHTGKPTGVAVSHCITWFQTQLIPTTCQIRYHSHSWDDRSAAQLRILIPRRFLEYHMMSRVRQLTLVWTKQKRYHLGTGSQRCLRLCTCLQ